ncbi:MAG: hypothetical protein NT023_01360 [Armatimonadetes bacterium]|nr:hypothetical protein [Armatimonadota bacterium]
MKTLVSYFVSELASRVGLLSSYKSPALKSAGDSVIANALGLLDR